MSGKHFTLTISQSTIDGSDFTIHLKEPGKKRETPLLQMHFVEHRVFDSSFAEDLVGTVARQLARRLIDNKGLPALPAHHQACEEEARTAVQNILEKMRGRA